MKCNDSSDVLGLPFVVAKERLQNMGYNIEEVKYTFSPKNSKVNTPRVVRQNIVDGKNIQLVLANSPWVSASR